MIMTDLAVFCMHCENCGIVEIYMFVNFCNFMVVYEVERNPHLTNQW